MSEMSQLQNVSHISQIVIHAMYVADFVDATYGTYLKVVRYTADVTYATDAK